VKDPIAERRLLYSTKGGGERKELVIKIGRPYWLRDEVAACPLEWEGLFGALPDVQGADLLQALHLAANVEPMLKALRNKYDFYFPNGDSYHEPDDGSKQSS